MVNALNVFSRREVKSSLLLEDYQGTVQTPLLLLLTRLSHEETHSLASINIQSSLSCILSLVCCQSMSTITPPLPRCASYARLTRRAARPLCTSVHLRETTLFCGVCWLDFGQASLQEELAVAPALLPPTSSEAVVTENRPALSAQPAGGRLSRTRPGLEVRLQEASPEPGCRRPPQSRAAGGLPRAGLQEASPEPGCSLMELHPDGAAA